MSHWNYRVMRRTYLSDFGGETLDEIYEVHYDDNGNVTGWTERPGGPCYYVDADDGEGSIRDDIQRMMEACDKPILDYETGKEIE